MVQLMPRTVYMAARGYPSEPVPGVEYMAAGVQGVEHRLEVVHRTGADHMAAMAHSTATAHRAA